MFFFLSGETYLFSPLIQNADSFFMKKQDEPRTVIQLSNERTNERTNKPIASTDETEESSQEDWHLDESHQARHCVEEAHEKTLLCLPS
jgi:hypothetical protein